MLPERLFRPTETHNPMPGRVAGMEAEDTHAVAGDTSAASDEDLPCITAVECSPERTVFTEDDNNDGWISTDTTVGVER